MNRRMELANAQIYHYIDMIWSYNASSSTWCIVGLILGLILVYSLGANLAQCPLDCWRKKHPCTLTPSTWMLTLSSPEWLNPTVTPESVREKSGQGTRYNLRIPPRQVLGGSFHFHQTDRRLAIPLSFFKAIFEEAIFSYIFSAS